MKQETKSEQDMNAAKETWIDEVMESLDGIQPAEPGPFLWTRIVGKTQAVKNIPAGYMWLAAASFIILLSVNVLVIKPKHEQTFVNHSLAEQFQLDTPSTIDYN